MSSKPAPAPTLLVHGVRVADVVGRCRMAALSFTNGAGAWEKAELAHWLIGPYRDSTHMGSNAPPPMFPSRPPRGYVEPAGVDELLADAHMRVISVLENTAISRDKLAFARKSPPSTRCTRSSTGRGRAVGCRSTRRACAWPTAC